MSKHLNPLEKEFLIRTYRSNQTVKMKDFCEKNNVSVGAFQKWIKQYDGKASLLCNRIRYTGEL